MKNKIKYPLLLSVGFLSLLGAVQPHKEVKAIGYNPAFKKDIDNSEKKSNEIINSITKQLEFYLPGAKAAYKETSLNKVLATDYGKKDYPSINKDNNEGITQEGEIDINSLKKRITEPSQIELAELVNLYHFNFTDQTELHSIDPSNTEVDKLKPSDKLNYLDYITLINKVKENPNYTEKQKTDAYSAIEKDLQNSIDLLYGIASGSAPDSTLLSWGESKSVNAPFAPGKYSYIQLLSAYNKDEKIQSTLGFYSAILDTLKQMKDYSTNLRQGNMSVTISRDVQEKRIDDAWKDVDAKLIKPIHNTLSDIKAENDAKDKGDGWQSNQLEKDGLSDKE